MDIKYYIISYIIFTVCNYAMRLYETVRNEREYIDNEGGAPLGDGTYIFMLVSMFARVLFAFITYFILDNWLPVAISDNIWSSMLASALVVICLEVFTATVVAIAMQVVTKIQIKRKRNRLEQKADMLNQELIEKQNKKNQESDD